MARRLFLERRTYRRARMQDAARLLPIFGLILIFGPIFIRGDQGTDLASGLVYYLAIWFGLIALTAIVSRSLASMATMDEDTPSEKDRS